MKSLLPMLLAVVCYVLDYFVYAFSDALHGSEFGIFSTCWMLWFVHQLMDLNWQRQVIMIGGLGLVLWAHGVYGLAEVWVWLTVMVFWAVVYQSWFVIATSVQKHFFVVIGFGVMLLLPRIKVALLMHSPGFYLLESRFWVLLGINVCLYLFFLGRIFVYIQTWMEVQDVPESVP